jgi:hypothetical protein
VRSAPVFCVNKTNRAGAHSTWVRMHGQNPLVYNIFIYGTLSSCVCHTCRTLSYSLFFNNQTDQEDKTEGLEREGLEMDSVPDP